MKTCQDYALEYIYRFPKTEKELRIQLSKKGYYGIEIDETVDWLKRKGFVDDVNFATMYIESELVHKGKPSIIILKKLYEKWVDKQIIKDLMEKFEWQAQNGINERIHKEIEKWKKQWLEWVPLIQKLLSRWYTLDEVKKSIKSFKN